MCVSFCKQQQQPKTNYQPTNQPTNQPINQPTNQNTRVLFGDILSPNDPWNDRFINPCPAKAILLLPLGGAVMRVRPEATAYCFRSMKVRSDQIGEHGNV